MHHFIILQISHHPLLSNFAWFFILSLYVCIRCFITSFLTGHVKGSNNNNTSSWCYLIISLKSQVYLKLQSHATSKTGSGAKNSSAFLKSPTSTLLHTISASEKSSYVAHINHYLADDVFLKKHLPIDSSTDDLFEIAKDGVLIWWSSPTASLLILYSMLPTLAYLFHNTFFCDAASSSMWQCPEQLMKGQSILRLPSIHGKEMKITPFASILQRLLVVL